MLRFEDTRIINIIQEKSHTNLGSTSGPCPSLRGPAGLPYGLVVLSPERDPAFLLSTPNKKKRFSTGLERAPQHATHNRSPLRSCGPCLPYAKALDLLLRFRLQWIHDHTDNHTNEPFIVWLSHPASLTKINPGHFFARGFSPSHTLFLETPWAERALPPLLPEERKVHAIVLDGFARSRVVTQLARRWLRPSTQTSNALIPADQLAPLHGGGYGPNLSPIPCSAARFPACSQGHEQQRRLFILSAQPNSLGDDTP